jgi:hypothetical protein
VLALRADFYWRLRESPLWAELAGMSRLDIAPLQGAALAQAIIAPAMQVGVRLEARLCDRLVADAADQPGALPLAQETLRMLWRRRRNWYLGLAEYEELGNGGRGIDLVIAICADTTMDGLTSAQQTIARRVLLRLVSFGEEYADKHRRRELQELRSVTDNDAEFRTVLQHLAAGRLITINGDEAHHDALVDLSHEAVITAWPQFQVWIRDIGTSWQRRRQLEARVSERIAHGRMARLFDSEELAEVVVWMQSAAVRELGAVAGLSALVEASKSQIDKVRRRTRVVTLAVLGVLSLTMLSAGVLVDDLIGVLILGSITMIVTIVGGIVTIPSFNR